MRMRLFMRRACGSYQRSISTCRPSMVKLSPGWRFAITGSGFIRSIRKPPPGARIRDHLLEHLEVLALALEVPERGEEVQHPVEGLAGERQAPHVAGHPRQVGPLGEQGERQVGTQHPVARAGAARRCAGPRRTPGRGSARGSPPVRASCSSTKSAWRSASVPVVVGVELQVLLAEPLAVPGHRRDDTPRGLAAARRDAGRIEA